MQEDCPSLRDWELIVDDLSKAGWSWGCFSAIDSKGRTIWIADAHRDDGKRFVVYADEKLTAFVELEAAIRDAKHANTQSHSFAASGCAFSSISRNHRLSGRKTTAFQ
jgi:hypothetical protein